MDLLALRYVGFLRILLMRNGPYNPHTLQFHLALIRGEEINDFEIKGKMHIFDLEGKTRHLTSIFNVFRDGDLKMFADRKLTIEIGNEHKAWMARRKKWYIDYMQSRFGRFITAESYATFERFSDGDYIPFHNTQKFTDLFYDGTSFVDSVLDFILQDPTYKNLINDHDDKEWFWWNPLDIYRFLKRCPTEKDELAFFSDIPAREIGEDNEELLVKSLPHQSVNIEFAQFLKRFGESLYTTTTETKNKSKPDSSSPGRAEDLEEEQEDHTWDELHKKYFSRYKNKTEANRDRFVSNLINVALSGFVTKKEKPTLKKQSGKKVWMTNENFESSSDIQFSENIEDNIKRHFKDFSKSTFFKNQEKLNVSEKIKENEKKIEKTPTESSKNPFDPENPEMARMIMSVVQKMPQYALNSASVAPHHFRHHHHPPNAPDYPYIYHELDLDHPSVFSQTNIAQNLDNISSKTKSATLQLKKTLAKRPRTNSDDQNIQQTQKKKKGNTNTSIESDSSSDSSDSDNDQKSNNTNPSESTDDG